MGRLCFSLVERAVTSWDDAPLESLESRAMTVIVITGATRGIGRAAAIELARRGAEIAVVGRERERVEAVAREAQTAGGGRRCTCTSPI